MSIPHAILYNQVINPTSPAKAGAFSATFTITVHPQATEAIISIISMLYMILSPMYRLLRLL